MENSYIMGPNHNAGNWGPQRSKNKEQNKSRNNEPKERETGG